jgi:TolB-like protein
VRGNPAVFRGLAFIVFAGGPAAAQTRQVTVAVLPFEDRGSYGQDKDIYRALRLGIPATLTSELRGHPELRLVERSRVAQELRSQGLGSNPRLDAATAARIGKQVGARYAVTGNFEDFYGRFHLDARVIDTETGQIVKVVSNNDPKLQNLADLFRIVQLVGHRVLTESTQGSSPRTNSSEPRAVPTEALTQFSLGLLYENEGDSGKAREHYQRALSSFPEYRDAREGLDRVKTP